MDEGTAQRRFDAVVEEQELPSKPSTMPDWQQEALYTWEGDFCYPHMRRVNETQARSLIDAIARDYRIKPPKLVMMPRTDSSAYTGDDHVIHFGHRDHIGLLHEMAHALCKKFIGESDAAPHSPLFVWKVIELYHRYGGLNLNYMVLSAMQRRLTGDSTASQNTEPRVSFRPNPVFSRQPH
jgi:hypothetical protein